MATARLGKDDLLLRFNARQSTPLDHMDPAAAGPLPTFSQVDAHRRPGPVATACRRSFFPYRYALCFPLSLVLNSIAINILSAYTTGLVILL